MLKDAGAAFVIVGHSERRAAGENDEIIKKQLNEVGEAKLRAVLCVGERVREESGEHFSVIKEQLRSALEGSSKKVFSKLVVAYEPVWAIGKQAADAMKPQEVQESTIFIKKSLTELLGREVAAKIPVLYGGSVEESNAAALLKEGGVNGFLVGHASASLETFLPILKACK
jgi:triosephosphate isomerase